MLRTTAIAVLSAAILTVSSCTEAPDDAAENTEQSASGEQPYIAPTQPWTGLWYAVVDHDVRICLLPMYGATNVATYENFIRTAVASWVFAASGVSNGLAPLHTGVVFTDQNCTNSDLTIWLHPGWASTTKIDPFPDTSVPDKFRTRPYFNTSSVLARPYMRIFDNTAEETVLHEFGHAFGLADTYEDGAGCKEYQPPSVMCQSSPTLTNDDINGVRQTFREALYVLFDFAVGYTRYTSADSGRCMDAVGGDSTGNGTLVGIWDCGITSNQAWRWDANTKAIIGEQSGRCLDVEGGEGATHNSARVQLWDCLGTTNQQWEPIGNGALRGVGSGRCLDVTGASRDNGARLQIYDCHGGPNQRWYR